MNIGFLTIYYPPFFGGVENHVHALAVRLARKHTVHVFTLDRKGSDVVALKEECLEGVHVHRFRPLFHYRFYFLLSPSLLFSVLRQKLDVLHIHGFGFLWFDFICFMKKLFSWKTRFVNTPHGPFMALQDYSLWKRILKFFVWSFELFFNKLYDVVIQVNPSQILWMRSSGISSQKIVYIPNGIDSSAFVPFLRREKLHDKNLLCTVGRITSYKGIDQVLAVLPSLIKKFPRLVYVIAGRDDGDVARLQKIVADAHLSSHVRFFVDISEKDKLSLLSAAQIFIISSEWEAFGIAPLEAMARGTAVVSTKTEGCAFLVTPACGFLYDFGDLIALEKHLLFLLSHPSLCKKMQKSAVKRAREFLWEEIVPLVEKTYNA